jgi:hypothetical protein
MNQVGETTPQGKMFSSRVAYMIAILDVLRAAGGRLQSPEVFEHIQSSDAARTADIETLQPSGETRFVKEVRFARLELVKAGLVEQGEPGSWSLSTAGWSSFLTPAEAQALVTLRRRGRLQKFDRSSVTGGPTTGPRPASYTATIARTVAAQSWLYLLRFGGSDIWKVGHAQDLDARLAAINRHIPTELLGMRWAIFARKPCHDSLAAYGLEQNLLTRLMVCRTEGERVRCPRDQIIEAWRRVCAAQEIISPDC